ncbi:hypothetical protein, partial [Burkholderia cenocepacia]|uniref:hypothetical protein n=1 Tax=Burkholderia cenocepacia TaxID=95486 RepID=UPI001BA2B742
STGGHRLAGANPWIGTTICTGNSPKADHELRLKPDHPMGSGQNLIGVMKRWAEGNRKRAPRSGETASRRRLPSLY